MGNNRKKACLGKRAYSEQGAWHQSRQTRKYARITRPYLCPFCKSWHLGTLKDLTMDALFKRIEQERASR